MCRFLHEWPGGSLAAAGGGFRTSCEFETPHLFDLGPLCAIYDPFQILTGLCRCLQWGFNEGPGGSPAGAGGGFNHL